MEVEEVILPEPSRAKLDGIVSQMVANKESDENIQLLISDFKQKYGQKKSDPSIADPAAPASAVGGESGVAPVSDAELLAEANKVWRENKEMTSTLTAEAIGIKPSRFEDKRIELRNLESETSKLANQLSENSEYPALQQLTELYAVQEFAKTNKMDDVGIQAQIDQLRNVPVTDTWRDIKTLSVGEGEIQIPEKLKKSAFKTYGEMFDATMAGDAKYRETYSRAKQLTEELAPEIAKRRQVAQYVPDGKDAYGNEYLKLNPMQSFVESFDQSVDHIGIGLMKMNPLFSKEELMERLKRKDVEQMLFPKRADGPLAEATGMLGGVAPLLATTPFASTAIGGLALNALTFGVSDLGGGLVEGYSEAKAKGASDEEAMEFANKIGLEKGATGALVGATMPAQAALGNKLFLNKVEADGFRSFLATQGVMAPVFMGKHAIDNLYAQTQGSDRDAMQGVGEAGISAVIIAGMTHALVNVPNMPRQIKNRFENVIAKNFEPLSEVFDAGVKEGAIDFATAERIQSKAKAYDVIGKNNPPEIEAALLEKGERLNLLADEIKKRKTANPNADVADLEVEMEVRKKEIRETKGTLLTEQEQKKFESLLVRETEVPAEGAEKKELLPSEKEELRHYQRRMEQAEKLAGVEAKRIEDEQAAIAAKESPVISVSEMIDQPAIYNGERAVIKQDGQTVIARTATGREYEIGNVEEVGSHPIKDYGIEQRNSVVSANENGNVVVRDEEFINNFSDPVSAINYDENGNVVSVNLENKKGQKRAFRGDVAEDIAYQITLKELAKRDEISEFETFINEEDGNTIKDLRDAGLSSATKGETIEGNESLPREKAARRDRTGTTVDLSGGERTGENGNLDKVNDAGRESGRGAGDVEIPEQDVSSESGIGGVQDAGGKEATGGKSKDLTPADIHSIADDAGVKWDNDADFMAMSKKLTGKEHLDDMTPAELEKVGNFVLDKAVSDGLKEISENKENKAFEDFIQEDADVRKDIEENKIEKNEIAKPIEDGGTESVSEEARNYGRNAIAERGRDKGEILSSEEEAKRKIDDPEQNVPFQSSQAYNKKYGLPTAKKHVTKKSDPVEQTPIAEMYVKLQDVTRPDYKETPLEKGVFDKFKKKFPEIIKKFGITNYKELVEKSYAQLIHEVNLQYENMKIRTTFHDGTFEYKNSRELLDDVHNFSHLFAFRGGDDHVFLGSKTADKDGLTANDKFRAVHDYYGHATDGYEFGKNGEENAWLSHSKMFSPLAEWAMASETRGQNSWVNYSGKNEVALEKIKTGSAAIRKGEAEGDKELVELGKKMLEEGRAEFQYAEQKGIVLPPEMIDAAKYNGIKKGKEVPKELMPKQDVAMTKEELAKSRKKLLNEEPTNLRQAIMQWFLGGGKVNTADVKRYLGTRTKGDWQDLIGKHKNGGSKNSVDKIAMDQFGDWLNDKSMSDHDIANSIMEVIGMRKVDMEAELRGADEQKKFLEKNGVSQKEYERMAEEGQIIEDIKEVAPEIDADVLAEAERALDAIELSEEDNASIDKYLEQFADADGNIDWADAMLKAEEVFHRETIPLTENGLNQFNKIFADQQKQFEYERERTKQKEIPSDGNSQGAAGEKEAKQKSEPAGGKSKSEIAREKLAAAKEKAKAIRDKQDNNLAATKDPFKDAEERARADREVFDAYVDLARAYISETADAALHTIEEFAKFAGEKIEDVREAWEHVTKKADVDTTDLRQATIEENRAKYGTGEVTEKQVTSRAKLEKSADKKMAEGFDAKKLINKILDDKEAITDVERTILGRYQAAKEGEIDKLTTDIDNAIYEGDMKTVEELTEVRNAAIDELSQIHKAGEVSGTISGKALQSIQNQRLKDYSLANMFARKQKSTGKKLTPEEIAEVQNQYKAIKAAKEKLEKKVSALEEKLKEKIAQRAFDREAADVRKEKRQVTRTILQKERVDIIAEIKKKMQPKGMLALPIEIVPDVAKLARNYAEEGLTRVQDVVDRIHEDLKDVIDGLEKRDIRDAISGYGKETEKKTKTELQKQMDDLKMQMKLMSKLEDLEAGRDLPKTEKAKTQYSQEVKDLKAQIKAFQDSEKPTKGEISLKGYKTRTANRIQELKDKLAAGDFEKTERPKLQMDEEALELKDDYRKARYDYELALQRDELNRRSGAEKARSAVYEVLNIGRAVMTSFDFSAPLRQGFVATTAHPKMALGAAAEMFKQSLSQKKFDRWFEDLENSHEFTLMKDSGLYIADPHNISLTAKEEQFMTNLAAKIPVVGMIIKGSERAYVSYLNKMRADIFQNGVDAFESQGITFDNKPEVYKAWADFVNNSTGRGKLKTPVGDLEGAAEVLNTAFFSPRLMASRIALLNPYNYVKMPKEVRAKAAGDMVKTISVGMSVMALAYLAGADVEHDPRSTDFGKIKFGNTRWDVWGGFQGYVRILAQLLSGESKSTSGTINKLDGKTFPFTTRTDKLGTFLRGKLAPIPSLAYDLAEGENVVGEPVELEPELLKRFAPMILQDIKKAAEDQGNKAIFTVGIPSLFGVSANTFEGKPEPASKEQVTKDMEEAMKKVRNTQKPKMKKPAFTR